MAGMLDEAVALADANVALGWEPSIGRSFK